MASSSTANDALSVAPAHPSSAQHHRRIRTSCIRGDVGSMIAHSCASTPAVGAPASSTVIGDANVAQHEPSANLN
eukprot:IDg15824t1